MEPATLFALFLILIGLALAALSYVFATRDGMAVAVASGSSGNWLLWRLISPWNMLHADKSWQERLLALCGVTLAIGVLILVSSLGSNFETPPAS